MSTQEHMPVEASQASNDTAHALAVCKIMSSQASSIPDITQPFSRRPRSVSTDPKAKYNTPGSVPASSTRRRPKSRSSSVASNRTIPGESQFELGGHYSYPNTPSETCSIPGSDSDNTPKRGRQSAITKCLSKEQANALHTKCSRIERSLREVVVNPISTCSIGINVAVAGDMTYAVGDDISRELKKIDENDLFDSAIKLEIVNNFIQETERILAVSKADLATYP